MKFTLINRAKQEAFALPTVLIASVVMLIVLLSAIGASSSIRSAIDNQYYNQITREAIESGLTLATECLKQNPTPGWTDASPLRPGSSCSGSASESGYVIDTPTLKTSFTVGAFTTDAEGRSIINAKGVVSLRRASSPTTVTQTIDQTTRRALQIVPLFANLSGNDSHTCALASKQVFCWGSNTYGQLGNGTTTNSLTPKAIKYTNGLQAGTITKIGTGNAHTCALSQSQVWCWGTGTYGQLGIGTAPTAVTNPTKVTDLEGFTVQDLSVGAYNTCAVVNSRAYCWGWNPDGQLGDGTTVNKLVPTKASTASALSTVNVTQIATNDYHTCARKSDNTAACWGRNTSGQLGNQTNTSSLVAVAFYGNGVTQVEVGSHHTCIMASSRLWCTGDNAYGQLGYGNTTDRNFHNGAVAGAMGANLVTAYSLGDYHTCAISLGKAYCWGRNADGPGQIGDNSSTNRLSPVAVYATGALSGKTMTDIFASDFHSCAVDNTKKAYCWGRNSYGQLGDNTTTNRLVPVAVYTANFKPVFTDF
jgi:alpha-tubulin suppressor-like RCC1 family protein